MTLSITRPLAAVGIGRKDYSMNAEFSTESLIRSHLERSIWLDELTYWTPPFPWAYFSVLQFSDAEGNLLYYAPEDIKYIIYNIVLVGEYHALTVAALQKFSWPEIEYVDTVAEVYGYGRAEIHLTKGHVCEPGRLYAVALTQWSEKDLFTAYSNVHGMSDLVVE